MRHVVLQKMHDGSDAHNPGANRSDSFPTSAH